MLEKFRANVLKDTKCCCWWYVFGSPWDKNNVALGQKRFYLSGGL